MRLVLWITTRSTEKRPKTANEDHMASKRKPDIVNKHDFIIFSVGKIDSKRNQWSAFQGVFISVSMARG